MSLITEEQPKETMRRSNLRNNFLKNKTEENKIWYEKQRNKCASFKKCWKVILRKLRWKKVIDNKQFWKTIRPLISDKSV